MSANYKCVELALELVDELNKRMATPYTSVVQSFDTAGFPTIDMNDGSEATTEDAVFIRVASRSWSLTKDIIGNAQTVYTPDVIQIVTEQGTTDTTMFYVSIAHALATLATCAKRGTRVELWETANGTIPNTVTPATDTTQLTGATLKASFEPDLYWPLLSSQ